MSDIKKWLDIVRSSSILEESNVTINLSLNLNGKDDTDTPVDIKVDPVITTPPTPIVPKQEVISDPVPVASSNKTYKENDTVLLNPKIGTGVGRFVSYTKNGAIIDIKGAFSELTLDQFSSFDRTGTDVYNGSNDWFHVSDQVDSIGSQRDKPEFRAGDMVKIKDVYGTSIGPGFGIFVAYSTSGQECIISFDNKSITVPVSDVEAVLEQNAKDNFDQMDNDGVLSPMSLGSDNVQVKMTGQETNMGKTDDFSKWMSTVEEALSGENEKSLEENAESHPGCDCGNWDCATCFPDATQVDDPVAKFQAGGGKVNQIPYADGERERKLAGKTLASKHIGTGKSTGKASDTSGLAARLNTKEKPVTPVIGSNNIDEEDMDFEERPAGGGVKLGDIVKKTEFRKTGGQESPLSFGDENLDEEPTDNLDASAGFGSDDGGYGPDDGMMGQDDNELKQELISQIMYMQDLGLSNSRVQYDDVTLMSLPPEELQRVHDEVNAKLSEAPGDKPKPKPTKPTDPDLDFLGGIDDTFGNDQLPAIPDNNDDGEFNDVQDHPSDEPSMKLPTASADATRRATANINPTDLMRDFMGRINPAAGGEEPALPDAPEDAVVLRTANDVPAVISSAMQAAGTQSPEWHTVNNLPGYNQQNIRGMGRQVFGMFTSTPLENIQTIANVQGQGPNTDAELRAVASWLRNNAEDLGQVELDHGEAIPGYKPDVKEFRINGVRFHVVRDPMGQYIYAYPDKDARIQGAGNAQIGNQRPALGGNMPRLRESENFNLKPTLMEQIQWDEELEEAFIEESSLSRLIGKQKGGQRLVQWLHRKHKLSNDADLQPAPFSERVLWKEYKRNPDNFIIVSGSNGVAGIKPSEKDIKAKQEIARKKNKPYDPGGDSTLKYQIIAFTDDGAQVDPELLRAPVDPNAEPEVRDVDPTIINARMGKIHGKDMQNPNNVFNLLADQIGTLRNVYIANDLHGAVEREKINKRADMKKPPVASSEAALGTIFNRVKPVLKTLANQAHGNLLRSAKRAIEGGNFEAAQKASAAGAKLKQVLIALDTSADVRMQASIRQALTQALQDGARQSGEEYGDFVQRMASGNSAQMKPVLDSLRDRLVGIQ